MSPVFLSKSHYEKIHNRLGRQVVPAGYDLRVNKLNIQGSLQKQAERKL